ncbi:MAG: PAS domain-containing sensor histidine kinase [Cyanobacteria bacterium REEB67]|nr:PAS domain-containing sensor histidine kinase [Cyanobacteria bacterium REEB67]
MKLLPKFSLSQKVLFLVALPMAAQLFLIVGLTKVQNDSEKQLAETEQARKIADGINHLSTDVYELVGTMGDEKSLIALSTTEGPYLEYRKRFEGDFADLRRLAADKPEILIDIDKSAKALDQVTEDLVELKKSLLLYGSHFRDERRPMWRKLREDTLRAIDSELFSVGEKSRRLADQNPEIHAAMRRNQQQVMITAAIAGILLTVAIAVILTKSITQRLARMTENTYRLASDKPLHPVQVGSDDISKLDQVFHSMASALAGAARKESAFIDSANDVLCMVGSNGRINSINPACQKQFGFPREDLLGSHLRDLVLPADQERARHYFDRVHEGAAPDTIELRMRRVDRTIIDSIWSAQWSKEEDSFFCTIHDITQIREAERAKQEILAMVTHDLKTPLTTLDNALDLLANATAEKRNYYVGMAKRNVSHMTNLIADLLDIEKAKAGMIKLAKEEFPISECIDATISNTAAMAEARQVKVISQAPDLLIEADPDALARVMINLVSNAIKFSTPGSEVVIGAERTKGFAQIWVKDQGQGIAAADLDKVFDRFQQAGRSRGSQNEGGTGLGLTICKEFIRLHGGKIWAESQPNQGSKFTFTLPG